MPPVAPAPGTRGSEISRDEFRHVDRHPGPQKLSGKRTFFTALGSSLFFKVHNLGQAATVARRPAESRIEKYLNQVPGERVADHQSAKADQVQIIVLNALVRGKSVVNQARPHARHLVGSDTGANAAAADGDAALHLPASDGTCQRHNKIRIIVIRDHPAVAEINHLMARRAQPSHELFL